MGNLLTSHKPSPRHKAPVVTQTDKAILDIKIARKALVTAKRQQEALGERALATVQELVKAAKKDKALVALRKRKLHDQQAMQLDANILKLDEQLISLETSAQQVEVVGVLRTANAAMKAMQQQMPLEDVERLMEDNAEAAQYVEAVNSLLAQDLVGVSEEGLEAELQSLEAEMVGEEVAQLPQPPETPADWQKQSTPADELPEVPTHEVAVARTEHAEECGLERVAVPA